MNRQEFQNKVNALIKDTGASLFEAQKIVENQYLEMTRQRRKMIEEKENEAAKYLIENPDSKTVLVPVHEFISKEQALAIVHSTINVNKFHFISQLSHGEKDTWLIASEFPITQADALNILENLTVEKYTAYEIEMIVTKHVPFDLR